MKSGLDKKFIESIDGHIRNAEGKAARTELQQLNRNKIAPKDRPIVASLYRRAGLADLSIRLLSKIIRPPKGAPSRATDLEKTEYAGALIRLGAIAEATDLLEEVDTKQTPLALFIKATAKIVLWDYAGSIEILKEAIASPDLDSFTKMVCEVNLASALVHEGYFPEARNELERLKRETKSISSVLYGSTLKYWAELKLERQDIEGARELLSNAEETFEYFGGTEGFLVRKWLLIADLIELGAIKDNLRRLEVLKKEAKRIGHWETIRDLDFYKAYYKRDNTLFYHLYFGTPFASYRNRIVKRWGEPISIPTEYIWKIGKPTKKVPLDFREGQSSNATLKVGQTMQRLYSALTSDFYRPFKANELYALTFPEEYLNPTSSKARLHICIQRLRAWFKENKIPLTINERDTHYSLSSTSGCILKITTEQERAVDPIEFKLRILAQQFENIFSISQAKAALNTSKNSTFRILKEGVSRGLLKRSGSGRACRYQFTSEFQRTQKAA